MTLPDSLTSSTARRTRFLARGACAAAISVGALISTISSRAFADDPSPADQALATTLFMEGRRLMEAGSIAEACDKFAESQRLVPAGGTLLNLAACHEKQGRTASAWTEFNAGLAQARRDGREDRARIASERMAALEQRLSTLKVVVESRAPDLVVMIDKTAVRAPAWGVAVPVDPGEHVVEASAPHKKPLEIRVIVGPDHDAKTVSLPALADAPEARAAVVPPPAPIAAAQTPAPAPARDRADAPKAERSLAVRDAMTVSSAVIGVAGVVFGSYYGLRAFSKHADSNQACPGEKCTRDGVTLNDEAQTAATVSTVAFAIGAVGLGTAAVLLFTRPSASSSAKGSTSSPAVAITPQGAFVGWRGSF